MENELNQVHKTMRLYQTFFSTGSFSQAAPLRWENQHKKNNNRMSKRFSEQQLAET